MPEEKNWWAPVWRGLVCDAEATHYRRMRMAVWLYLFLLLHADRRSGLLLRKISTISRDTGISRDCIQRWLRVLRAHGYVRTRNSGRALEIEIRKWKPLPGVGKVPQQMSENGHNSSRNNRTDHRGLISLKSLVLQRKNGPRRGPNESENKEKKDEERKS